MSLSIALPAPVNPSWDESEDYRSLKNAPTIGALVSAKVSAPPYGQRKGWIPRTESDFGDGGAFPEIAVAQYPLGRLFFMNEEASFCRYLSLNIYHVFII